MVRSRSTGATLTGPWRHRDLAVNGIRLHVVVGRHFGPTRPLVLLLHGFAQFWWSWRAQIPALDDAGYSVAALDLRGYGGSDKTPHGYDPRTVAADVSSTVRSLGHTQAVLVGHDWGGVAAWSTTAYAPDQVRALASVAARTRSRCPGRSTTPPWAWPSCRSCRRPGCGSTTGGGWRRCCCAAPPGRRCGARPTCSATGTS